MANSPDSQFASVRDERSPRTATRFGCAAIFLLALAVRLIHYNQSLWCDEMTTLLGYVDVSWSKIIAPRAGEYVPNDHPLFSLLARLCLSAAGGSSGHSAGTIASLIRLPSLIAGAILPLAVAWPFRHRPFIALLTAMLLALNPWLISFSDEARGYSLMLLHGVLATNVLPDATRRRTITYGIIVAGMIYTVPIAVMLLIAHGAFILSFRRHQFGAWRRGAVIAFAFALVLYLPMSTGILYYYQHPMQTPENAADLVNQLPRFIVAGEWIPTHGDALIHAPAFHILSTSWLLPVFLLAIGSCLAVNDRDLRQPLRVMMLASAICGLAAVIAQRSAEVRFACWSAIWFVLAMVAILRWIRRRVGKVAGILASVLAIAWFGYRDLILLPSQPIREAMVSADTIAPPQEDLMMAFLSGYESAAIYGRQTVRQHPLVVASTPPEFQQAERNAIARTGHRPWVIMSFEYMPRAASPSFWNYFDSHYVLKTRLPGRISPVAIYVPR